MRRQYRIGLIMLYIVDAIFFCSTNPRQLSSVFLLVPFVLIFVTLWCTLWFAWGYLYVRKTIGSNALRRITILSALPVFLLLMQSVGSLGTRDLVTAVIFFGALYVYFTRSYMAKRA